ncbi:tyrosine-type recombinase/integrase [Methanogenium organophilum]|uniref:Tyrosine-type recombinase/integrase n=1 Tax=Methanogenium organophilum TaxID=2199 RepID=A0A9X9S476_METOG|nr:tyrosine-type recombinase/integrase [Methanogenium organophilum]WAI01366.1 tyrosine-type recombinase/integrase [Methanogenium organophilum]
MSDVTRHSGFHLPAKKYEEYAKTAISKGLAEGKITPDDAALLIEFVDEISINMNPQRVYKHYSILINWRTFIGPFRENQAGDLYRGIQQLKGYTRENGKPYSSHTISDYVRFIKRLYLWMVENEYTSIPEKKIMKIRVPATDEMTVTVEDLITEEEALRMIQTCWNSRDRAIISMLWDGGFRISELGTLQWKQVKFNEWNVVVNTAEKTGKPRHIPLVMSKAYIAQWKNDYPFEPVGDNHVFLTLDSCKPVQYAGLKKKITKIAKRAGIERKINPHLFRHSRITDLIRKGYQESVIKKMLWGNLTTTMFAVYAHLSDIDIDNEVALHEGIVTEDQRADSPLEARQCPRCYTINGPTMEYCNKCGLALTKGAVADRTKIKELLSELSKEQIIELLANAP